MFTSYRCLCLSLIFFIEYIFEIKELFFGKERLEELRQLNEYGKMNYNQKILPETQFTNINLKKVLLHDLNRKKDSSDNELMRQPLSTKFYMEQFKDNIVIVDAKGKIFFINKQFIEDSENFNWIRVNSNLNFREIRVKDVLILNNKIYCNNKLRMLFKNLAMKFTKSNF